ncbi:protein transporter tim9, variant 2 [Taiwanofungus camphoratus]|nr:protein transporter tim9, variant 2 [Antrodia cinnamomea]KAI0926935.1 protein transporter tim9, variant 2 [Antrodia cinnamomea]KAI0953470.1 protein transporter tim9, variant 2 [Antrodia cinnamomea]
MLRPIRHIVPCQLQDFLRMYSNLVERCFNACCNDFTSKALSSKEDQCVMNCTDKFLKHSERVGARFAEHNAEAMNSMNK